MSQKKVVKKKRNIRKTYTASEYSYLLKEVKSLYETNRELKSKLLNKEEYLMQIGKKIAFALGGTTVSVTSWKPGEKDIEWGFIMVEIGKLKEAKDLLDRIISRTFNN